MIIPVIDIMHNECVSGKSGRRSTYKKLRSIYGDNPLDIATALKEDGAQLIYIADLDKIERIDDNNNIISSINNIIPVMLDNGISSIEDIENNKNICSYNILATETMTSLDNIEEIFKKYDSNKLVVSIDIKNNELLVNNKDIDLEDVIYLIILKHTLKKILTTSLLEHYFMKVILVINYIWKVKKMKNKILTIGPITKDIIKTPTQTYIQTGGASYYQMWTLYQLKKEATAIITIGICDVEMINDFPEKNNIKPIITTQTMEYTNIYNKQLERTQKAKLPNNPITPEKISEKINIKEYDTAILSPLSKNDIPPETIKYLKTNNIKIILAPQGYLRTTDDNNNIISSKWDDKEKYLENVDIIALDEDEMKTAFNIQEITDTIIKDIIQKYNLNTIIMTKAEKGSNIYTKNKKIEIPAIKTKNNIDATGLGDTYIAAYTAKLDSNNIYEAGLYASIASKFKLESKGPLKVDEKLIQKELEKRIILN